ncbi:hypothetical protein AMEC673_01225 [Alteromonas macleodii str. 'English Channel 673']|uniref:Uncharacterized protein n=1 Tax=Alteromonas macleodii (strain English Channel 673) TaxID=1004788 RepID=A0AB32ZUE9_ALTME|nr:hypothetical protein [Alteromonas macleodii]AFT72949.1 hypothetical protein AMEC673_01215 [Alteromonas macleodii str. 'English Channel 673']AFT72951.1 hypothetical protein AMEC673_01225 [Alteromonas macleodii str. 'English Channel 673']
MQNQTASSLLTINPETNIVSGTITYEPGLEIQVGEKFKDIKPLRIEGEEGSVTLNLEFTVLEKRDRALLVEADATGQY